MAGEPIAPRSPIRTVGHGALPASAFGELVGRAGIDLVVDVRRYPGSRRHPHFMSDAMQVWLPERGIDYVWLSGLGGRRSPSAHSTNIGLRNPQFRVYADHMATQEFEEGVDELMAAAAMDRVAIMCAESLWWRCHRC